LSVIAIVGVRRVRRWVWHDRDGVHGVGGPVGPERQGTEAVIQDKSVGESE
jgi:hypothetical protein